MSIKGRKYGKLVAQLPKLAQWCNIRLQNDGRICFTFFAIEVVFLDYNEQLLATTRYYEMHGEFS
jgi:hypothetical protein